jgi:hypothetical protein
VKRILAVAAALALGCGIAWSQVPPSGSGTNGWLQAIYNQLGSGGSASRARTTVMGGNVGTTAAITAQLPAAAGQTTFLCGFDVSLTATAATSGNISISTVSNVQVLAGVGLAPAVVHTSMTFSPCLPGSAPNTVINVNTPIPGTGGVVSALAWGYTQ